MRFIRWRKSKRCTLQYLVPFFLKKTPLTWMGLLLSSRAVKPPLSSVTVSSTVDTALPTAVSISSSQQKHHLGQILISGCQTVWESEWVDVFIWMDMYADLQHIMIMWGRMDGCVMKRLKSFGLGHLFHSSCTSCSVRAERDQKPPATAESDRTMPTRWETTTPHKMGCPVGLYLTKKTKYKDMQDREVDCSCKSSWHNDCGCLFWVHSFCL